MLTYKSLGLILLIRRKLPTGPTQALIPEMARKTRNNIIEDLDIEMESMERALKALKEIKREIRRKSRSFRRELRKLYKKIVSIERSNPKAPKFSRDTSTKLREKNEDNSDKRPKVSHNTLNGGPKSGKKSSRPKSGSMVGLVGELGGHEDLPPNKSPKN